MIYLPIDRLSILAIRNSTKRLSPRRFRFFAELFLIYPKSAFRYFSVGVTNVPMIANDTSANFFKSLKDEGRSKYWIHILLFFIPFYFSLLRVSNSFRVSATKNVGIRKYMCIYIYIFFIVNNIIAFVSRLISVRVQNILSFPVVIIYRF